MNKIYLKLIAISLTLILSVTVVGMSSYAWLVLSGNPTVTGIQIAIGGGNTILVAPDMTTEVDGVIYHYPGPFSDNMNFSTQKGYAYLNELAGLTPVSTADGVNWFLPEYYDFFDEEVLRGTALSGSLKDFSEFIWDVELEHANVPANEPNRSEKGSYVFLDFWVVSPGDNYSLRVSTGTDTGSFVMDIPGIVKNEGADVLGKYSLSKPENVGSSALRIGFLANPFRVTDDTMLYYQSSPFFNANYTRLQGLYQEPNTGNANVEGNRFTIYEPNADLHPYGAAQNGAYVQTLPIGFVDGDIKPVSVYDRLTVQHSSSWLTLEGKTSSELEQRFQASLLMMEPDEMTAEEMTDAFFREYQQWQIAPYVTKGKFVTKSASLSSYGGAVSSEAFAALDSSGATEDVYIIKLEKNVPQRIRMFVWLEGQDVDCVNAVGTSSFVISLELAGGNDELT